MPPESIWRQCDSGTGSYRGTVLPFGLFYVTEACRRNIKVSARHVLVKCLKIPPDENLELLLFEKGKSPKGLLLEFCRNASTFMQLLQRKVTRW